MSVPLHLVSRVCYCFSALSEKCAGLPGMYLIYHLRSNGRVFGQDKRNDEAPREQCPEKAELVSVTLKETKYGV